VRGKPLRPTPKISRPWLIWSTVATSSARRSGWHSGSTWTAVPIFIRLVRAAIALAILSGADSTERSGAIWISASHIASSPQRSAASTCSNEVANACSSLIPAGRWNSWNMPNSKPIIFLRLHADHAGRPGAMRLSLAPRRARDSFPERDSIPGASLTDASASLRAKKNVALHALPARALGAAVSGPGAPAGLTTFGRRLACRKTADFSCIFCK
jgi:hypothetical protein